MEKLSKYQPFALALLRITAGYMFLLHGTAKLLEFPVSMTGGNGAVELFSLYGIGGLIEVIGGILVILGLFTRPAAFLMSGQMAYAYFFLLSAADNILLPIVNKGELALLYSVVFFLFVFSGPGAFALDNRFAKK